MASRGINKAICTSKEEETMSSPTCILFEISEDPILGKAVKRCLLGGGQTSCNGDIRYCERTDTIREYVLSQIAKAKRA